MDRRPPDYQSYLRIPDLLTLQDGLPHDPAQPMPTPEAPTVAPGDFLGNEERLFISVHQVFEIWFKVAIGELTAFQRTMGPPQESSLVPEDRIQWLVARLRRVVEILKLAIRHFDLMETLSPIDFLAFRDKLVPASGFQSLQMRQIEIVLGYPIRGRRILREGREMAEFLLEDDQHTLSLVEQSVQRHGDLRSIVMAWLSRTPVDFTSPGWREHNPGALQPWDSEELDLPRRRQLANHSWLCAQLEATMRQQAMVEAATPASQLSQAQRAHEAFRSAKLRYLSGLENEGELLPGGEGTPPLRTVESVAGSPLATRRTDDEIAWLRLVRGALLFIQTYPDIPLLSWPAALVDELLAIEEHLLLWRNRHARMVERVIGRRPGTGGSEGVGYLDRTQQHRIFDELWYSRTYLVDRAHLRREGQDTWLRDPRGFYATLAAAGGRAP